MSISFNNTQHIKVLKREMEFFMERAVLEILEEIQRSCKLNRMEVSITIKNRAKQQNIKIPKQIKKMMCQEVQVNKQKVFACRHCDKQFKQGRELGGHISRAHKNLKKESELEKEQTQKVQESEDVVAKQETISKEKKYKNKKIKKVTELPIKRRKIQKQKNREKKKKNEKQVINLNRQHSSMSDMGSYEDGQSYQIYEQSTRKTRINNESKSKQGLNEDIFQEE